MAEYIADIEPPPPVQIDENVNAEILEELTTFVNGLPVVKNLTFRETTLKRWYRGRNCNLEHAKKGIRRHIAWRIEKAIDEITEDDIEPEISTSKVLIAGPDVSNRPCMFIFVRRHFSGDVDEATMEKFIIFVLEQMVAQCVAGDSEEAISIVFDLFNFSVSQSMDYKALFQFIKILQYNYPYLVSKVYIANAPWVFSALYATFIRPFLAQDAISRISFLHSHEDLEQYISPELIPADYYECVAVASDDEDDEDEDEEEEEEGDEYELVEEDS